MHPGSGPSDRDNDVLFPPIREHLLRAGIAVCSFDKRGVGGSAGSWLEAGLYEQAGDLIAALAVFESESRRGLPLGLFGHSQGGWVVVEDETIWRLFAEISDYDPAPALSRITAPVLAIFGSADKITPAEESVVALRAAVRPELLQVEVFPEGDHRLFHGDPPRFVDGYLDRIS